MRLADFILNNTEPILKEWEQFARSIWPEGKASPLLLRDDAEGILRAAAKNMTTDQTGLEQSRKSQGEGADGGSSGKLDHASKDHALGRVRSGFDLMELVAEYRALRASVIRLWRESAAQTDDRDLVDQTRFNEAIDQSLAEAVRHFSTQMDRSREIFLGILGHDLRNPLNAMLLSSQSLSTLGLGEVAEVAAQITASGEAMARMLADFLDFTASRLGRGMPISPAKMDLAALCRAVVNESQASFPEKPLRLDLRGKLVGNWDEGRLRQVLSNLIGNAIQHGTGNEPILVSASAAAAGVEIRVQNSGKPIPKDAISSIFDPLVQVEPSQRSRSRQTGSMGLGLYIAREVVTAHGGTIEVKSSRAAGTVFIVKLPRKKPPL